MLRSGVSVAGSRMQDLRSSKDSESRVHGLARFRFQGPEFRVYGLPAVPRAVAHIVLAEPGLSLCFMV